MQGILGIETTVKAAPGESRDRAGNGAAEHPAAEALERFVAGEASPGEARQVVRHLLRGCAECSLTTARLWQWGEAPTRKPERRGLRLVRGER